jgi:hypothetical protein
MRRLRDNQNTSLGRARHWTKNCMPLLGEHNRNKGPFVIMAALDSLLCAIGNASLSLLKGMLVGQGACKSLPQLYPDVCHSVYVSAAAAERLASPS